MGIVKRFCSRAMHIHNGKITHIGAPYTVAEEYRAVNEELSEASLKSSNEKAAATQQTKISIVQGANKHLSTGDNLTVRIDYSKLASQVKGIGVAIYRNSGEYVFGANTFRDGFKLPAKPHIDYDIRMDVGAGTYVVKVGLFGADENRIVEFIDEGPKFRIKPDNQTWEGIVNLKHVWRNK
jgi:hypothetical protein